MKAETTFSPSGSSMHGISRGRVHKRHKEAQIQLYMTKLQTLVPIMPKGRISNLDIIHYVIAYIGYLKSQLEKPIGHYQVGEVLTPASPTKNQRQPLCPRSSPNTILPIDRPIFSFPTSNVTIPEKNDQLDRPMC